MKKILIIIVSILVANYAGLSQTKAGKIDTSAHAQYYSCPMHPDVISHEPGKCPKCGMELSLSTKEQMKVDVSKKYVCPVHLSVTSHDPGKCPQCGRKMNLSTKEQMKAEVVKLYTCPMHPEVSLDKNGVCPKCGKALVEKKNQ
jgi:transcription initiation factor IIE alpha subunit